MVSSRHRQGKKVFTLQEIVDLEKKYAVFLVKSLGGDGATLWKCTHPSCNSTRKRLKNEWASFEGFHTHVSRHPKENEPDSWPCEYCKKPRSFRERRSLFRHLRDVHNVDPSLIGGCKRRASDAGVPLAKKPRKSLNDLNSPNMESANFGSAEFESAGAEVVSAESGSADAGSADAGSADAGSADAGSADAGSADAGSADAGSAEVESTEIESARVGGGRAEHIRMRLRSARSGTQIKESSTSSESTGAHSDMDSTDDVDAENDSDGEYIVHGSNYEANASATNSSLTTCQRQHYVKDGRFPRQTRVCSVPSPSAPSILPPYQPCSAESHAVAGGFTPCSDLAKLGLRVTSGIGLSCMECQSILLSDSLHQHLKRVHKYRWIGQKVTNTMLNSMADHILETHSITLSSEIPQPTLPLTVIIPELVIEWCGQCPKCSQWVCDKDSDFEEHLRKCNVPSSVDKSTATFRWAAFPFKNTLSMNKNAKEKRTRWPYPENWQPPESTIAGPRPLSFQPTPAAVPRLFPHVGYSAEWATATGLTAYVRSLLETAPNSKELLVQELIGFFQNPSEKSARQYKHHLPQKIEFFLLGALHFCHQYLWEANAYTDTQHNDFRAVLVSGTKAHYNRIQPVTRRQYAQSLFQYILFPIRLFLARADNSKAKLLKDVKLKATPAVFKHVYNLFLMAQKGELVADEDSVISYQAVDGWENAIHQYLNSILTEEIHGGGNIACLSDQILCLGALRVHSPDFGFQCANAFTIRCSSLQHGLFSILVQSVRLHTLSGDVTPYKPFSTMPADKHIVVDVTDTDDMVNSESEELVVAQEQVEEETEEELTGYDETLIHDADRFFMQLAGYTSASMSTEAETHTPLKILFGMLKYVQPRPDQSGITYQRSHISEKWSVARPMAMRERRMVNFEVARDGQSITTIDRQSGIFYVVPLFTYRHVALTLVKQAEDATRKIVFQQPWLFDTFNYRQLSDNSADANSVFLQAANVSYLKQFHEGLHKLLWEDWGDPKRASSSNTPRSRKPYHEQPNRVAADTIQGLLISLVVLTTGICPRAFQFKHFLLDTHGTKGRNFFIVDGLPAIGNPKAKQHVVEVQEALWMLPAVAAKVFLFYYGVIRPAMDEIVTRMLQCELTPERRKSMFVRMFPLSEGVKKRRRKQVGNEDTDALDWIFNTEAIGNVVQKYTFQHASQADSKRAGFFPLRITCASVRSMNQALFRAFTPALFQTQTEGSTSIVDAAGQHTQITSTTHYGHVSNTAPAALGMSLGAASRYVGVSKVFQALLNLGHVPEEWKDILKSSKLIPTTEHLQVALWCARAKVCSDYGLGSLDKAKNIALASALLNTRRPYLMGSSTQNDTVVEALTTIGDQVLREVMHMVVFGNSEPRTYSLPPSFGYPEEDFGHAVLFIIIAIQEWQSGCHRPFSHEHADAQRWYDSMYTRAVQLGKTLRNSQGKNRGAYAALSHDVRYFQHGRSEETWESWELSGLEQV